MGDAGILKVSKIYCKIQETSEDFGKNSFLILESEV